MNKVTINGMSIISTGSISIINGKVFLDGKDHTPEGKIINIKVEGNVERLEVDACDLITVNTADTIKVTNGSVKVENEVKGNVSTVNGSVKCGNVGGSVSTVNGSIKRT